MRNNANGLIGFCLQLFERTDGDFQHFGIQCPESFIDKQAFDQYITGGKIRETDFPYTLLLNYREILGS